MSLRLTVFLTCMLCATASVAQPTFGTITVRKPKVKKVEPNTPIFDDIKGWYSSYLPIMNEMDGFPVATSNDSVEFARDGLFRRTMKEYLVVDGNNRVYWFASKIRSRKKLTRKWKRGSDRLKMRRGRYSRGDENQFVIDIFGENPEERLQFNGVICDTYFLLETHDLSVGQPNGEEGTMTAYYAQPK